MEAAREDHRFNCALSLRPLVDFWNRSIPQPGTAQAILLESIRTRVAQAPELLNPIEDLSILDNHHELVRDLMSAVFPPAFWETEVIGALVPFTLEPFYVSPTFRRLCIEKDGSFLGQLDVGCEAFVRARLIRFYLLILSRLYGMQRDLDYPLIRIVEDPETGLERHLRFRPDLRFVEAYPLDGAPAGLSDEQRHRILDHLTDPEVLGEIVPPEKFRISGFTVIHAIDVTQSEVLAALQRDLVDRESTFARGGLLQVQQKLRNLFRKPALVAGVAAIEGDRVLLMNTGCEATCSCFFTGSVHFPVSEFKGSIFERAMNLGKIFRIRDLSLETDRTPCEQEFLAAGARSLLVVPLFYEGLPVGMLHLGSPHPGDFGPTEELLASQVVPLFSMALKRSLAEVDNQVERIIKQKCTAVHPSVEWRFRKSVFEHLERNLAGQQSELEPIVFRDVYPLFATSDIRGSSEARNRAIREDLVEHLNLGLEVMRSACETTPVPILGELTHRIGTYLERVQQGLGAGDEMPVISFLRQEVEPAFPLLAGADGRVSQAIAAYETAVDSGLRTVYRRRRDFEESVSLLNERISAYLDREEAEAQAIFPHYFDRHQTDGIGYVIYIGASMVENGGFSDLHVKNLRLWQIIVACGIAWQCEDLKSTLKIPLEVTHLILVNYSPHSIRFRFDEKRFDVDGAYDVAHEIIRSRIDKATVGGGKERLTQPAKIALVYSRPEEASEIRRHVDFLQAQGFLKTDLESLELDDLPGVQGLKALRVGVNLAAAALAERVQRIGVGDALSAAGL